MTDQISKLRDYCERLDTHQGEIDIVALIERESQVLGEHLGPITQQPQAEPAQGSTDVLAVDFLQQRPDESRALTGHRSRFGGLLAVAATILVVVGVLVVSDRNSGDVATDPASTPSVADPVLAPDASDPVAPPTVVDPLGYRWSRVPDDKAVFGGGRMSSVTVGGPGLVAVGSDGGAAAVWTSVDGITWSRVPHDEAAFGSEDGQWMSSVTVGGPGLVAVGSDGGAAAVWTSVDGITWSRVPHDEAAFGSEDGQWMSSVTVGGPGLVAVGSVDTDNNPDERDDGVAAVWTSVDGITWSRVPHDEAVFGGADNQHMSDVTVGGPGLVAVGTDGQNVWDYSLSQVAAVWTSVDGVTWSRVAHDEAVFGEPDSESAEWAGQAMVGVTAGGPGLVAVGGETFGTDGFVAAVWTSVDGITWSRVPHDESVFGQLPGVWPMVSVTAAGPGLVAVGDAVWTSVDGITWSRVRDDEGFFGTGWSVTAAGAGLVVVGDAAVWVAE